MDRIEMDFQRNTCPHMEAVSMEWLRRKFTNNDFRTARRNMTITCDKCDCNQSQVWECLKDGCCARGCGRNARKHSIQHFHHFSAQGDDSHALCINIQTGMMWCHKCDIELLESSMYGNEAAGDPAYDQQLSNVRSLLGLPSQDASSPGFENMHLGFDNNEESSDEDIEYTTACVRSNSVKGLCGMANVGNTCYLNAATQCIGNCPPLVRYVKHCKGYYMTKTNNTNGGRLVHTFADTINTLWSGHVTCITPSNFVRAMFDVNPLFRGFGQQDSQEFLRSLLDNLHEQLKRELTPSEVEQRQAKEKKQWKAATGMDWEETDKEEKPVHGHTRPVPKDHSSIIQEVFQGVLLSSVRCLNCNKVSHTRDRFYDLSVSIPGKKLRQKLASEREREAKMATVGGKKEKTVGGNQESGSASPTHHWKDLKARSGWFHGIGSWLGLERHKTLGLQECLQSFCSVEELTGEERYKCEHCKGLHDCQKSLQLLELPQILCIHIKRFRYDAYFGSKLTNHILFPVEGLDMRPFCFNGVEGETLYDLIAVTNHHGAFGGGHYTAYVKNHRNKHWYHIDDSTVEACSASDVQRGEAYILFYCKRNTQDQQLQRQLLKAIANQESTEDKVLVSQHWYAKWLTMSVPGAITNCDFLCPHGAVNLSGSDTTLQMARLRCKAVPMSVWNVLHSKHEGGPQVTTLRKCMQCEEDYLALQERIRVEREMIQRYDKTFIESGEAWYLIDAKWLEHWREFCMEGTRLDAPGPVSNHCLLQGDTMEPRAHLLKAKHYRGVNSKVWSVFIQSYGGGPAIRRAQLDITSEAIAPPENEESVPMPQIRKGPSTGDSATGDGTANGGHGGQENGAAAANGKSPARSLD